MRSKGLAFGLLLLMCVIQHVQLTQAVNACGPGGACDCSDGTSVNCIGNSLTTIPSGIPATTTLLTLQSNQISRIPANAFAGLTAMHTLYLHQNKITSISGSAFTGLPVLHSLYLSDNLLTSIPADAFKDLSMLNYLALENNPFTTLPPGLFQGLPYVMFVMNLAPNNFTYGGNSVAPPSTYGSASEPHPCDAACATCYDAGSGACCALNCLTCNSSAPCTQCYDGYGMTSGSCELQQGGGGDSAAVIAAVVASVAGVAIIAAVFIVLRRRRSQGFVKRPNDSAGPVYQEAVELAISPLNHPTQSPKNDGSSVYDNVDPRQPQPLYEDFSTPSSTEGLYDNESPYVTGSNSRRVREGLTIVKYLASGNFGDVALGQVAFNVLPQRAQALLGRKAPSEAVQVAVKSLKSNADEQSHKDFESEATLMAPFVHPNVVRLLAALVESEPHLVLLEFVQYGDLHTLLQKSKKQSFEWSENEQVHAIRQIALGMEYLGTLHFVHRDLAARNCLVGKGMVVKIADFGLSRELTDENDYYRMQTRGKLPVKWMAPESMTFRKFSSMSDVWSFGVTAWECLSYGAMPYGNLEGRATLAHVEAGGRLPQPEHCSADLFGLMFSCWNTIPELRPTFTQLIKGLKGFEDGTPIREIGAML
ncbi:tyrosine-protein kinase transforming protein Fes, variant [Capsaspora owczarzaki ATCC 30864]|nr:tyrosine-protein kinase transforming protein Fes, variant [Capsaspora owczarzaki ATCC 30864]|eukprot:XP_011270681.1 tyrosine-protein kinase transforming protein Fes, variant [Capsaspora owczarzaki ATCC 30864]